MIKFKGVPSAESSRSVRGLGKGVSDKPYPRLCNVRRPRLEPGTFRSQTIRLYRLHQTHPSYTYIVEVIFLDNGKIYSGFNHPQSRMHQTTKVTKKKPPTTTKIGIRPKGYISSTPPKDKPIRKIISSTCSSCSQIFMSFS